MSARPRACLSTYDRFASPTSTIRSYATGWPVTSEVQRRKAYREPIRRKALRRDWGKAARRPLGFVVVGYLIVVTAASLYLDAYGDVTGLGMLLLFGPRWWMVLPWMILVPATLIVSRTPIVILAVIGVLVTLRGVLLFELPATIHRDASRRALRLVTYNTDRSVKLTQRIRSDLERWDAEVVLLQDCSPIVADYLRTITGVIVHTTPEFCMVSRVPVESVDQLRSPSRHVEGSIGRFGNIIRYRVRLAGGLVPIYSLHLETPRDALGMARKLGFELLHNSIVMRSADSHLASAWVGRTDSAFVVAGDFNLPYGSKILRRDWGDLTNAFTEVGTGIGNTMFSGRYAVRIDHVLTSKTLVVQSIMLERDFPSEHQPVIVDVRWR